VRLVGVVEILAKRERAIALLDEDGGALFPTRLDRRGFSLPTTNDRKEPWDADDELLLLRSRCASRRAGQVPSHISS
jgi:hypothetical protein